MVRVRVVCRWEGPGALEGGGQWFQMQLEDVVATTAAEITFSRLIIHSSHMQRMTGERSEYLISAPHK